jgi:hypothetical protein
MANRYTAAPGQPWTTVLDAYYGRATPNSGALATAYALLLCPSCWADGGHYYAYSEQDRRRMGWRLGDLRLCDDNYCINLSKEWPGS